MSVDGEAGRWMEPLSLHQQPLLVSQGAYHPDEKRQVGDTTHHRGNIDSPTDRLKIITARADKLEKRVCFM